MVWTKPSRISDGFAQTVQNLFSLPVVLDNLKPSKNTVIFVVNN
jgi:hypothetical protein